ncbi:ABC transporter permease [Terracidiphilus gabretensis]|uniref:ABC transporter permease n=1 Tax=Terracidiphilus gabretensis TaxID=1577687 RepID=UPI00071BE080|nr:ABC transporter permease [Terracidiphilus gabretensis]
MQNFSDTLSQVFRAIVANKLRSFLTMFGIAWGVGSLLVLVGLGEGFRSGQHRNMATLGDDLVMMWNGTIPAVANQHTGMRPYQLTLRDAEALRSLPELRGLTMELQRTDLYEVSQWSNTSSRVMGVDTTYPIVRNIPLSQGRFLNSDDLADRRRVAVLGYKTTHLLFPGRPFLGEAITINGTEFRIVGTLASLARGNNDSDDQKIYIPVTTMHELFPVKGENIPQDALTSIQYQPAIHGDSAAAIAAVHRVIAERHGFDPNMADAFDEWDTIRTGKMVGAIFTAMDVFLGGVGIVTLSLGAVGIVNIMLVSVTERTREIGLRKALGATQLSILSQFFWEGLLLTGVSGAIGIAVSAAFMETLQALFTGAIPGFDPPRLVPWSAALAMGSLVLCGVVAGLYPASKAAAMDPIEALRRE